MVQESLTRKYWKQIRKVGSELYDTHAQTINFLHEYFQLDSVVISQMFP